MMRPLRAPIFRAILVGAAIGATSAVAAYRLLPRRAPADRPPGEGQVEAPVPVGDAGAGDAGRDASAPDSGPPPPEGDERAATLAEQREALYRTMAVQLELPDAAISQVRTIFEGSELLGQGNPAVTVHPMTRTECRAIRAAAGLGHTHLDPICGARNMVPIFDPAAGETASQARVCVDQFEFPSIPCEYPVVYPTSREAADLCAAVGKRICDAHEWEGACAGALHSPAVEYSFRGERGSMREYHNGPREIRWAYGPKKDHRKCATASRKSDGCAGGGWRTCGSNTFPAGAFPGCVSPLGVYDQHGNVAEHMNLPIAATELSSAGGSGHTEMKGSWFIFAELEAHPDDCRWRAPDWHPSRLMADGSHRNYHLGFRCCKNTIPAPGAPAPTPAAPPSAAPTPAAP